MLNQGFRTLRFHISDPSLPADDHTRFRAFTPEVARQLEAMSSWNWTSVAPKSMRIGIGFMCVIVGLQKFLILFIVWLIAIMSRVAPLPAIAIFIGIGVVRSGDAA